MGQKINPLCLRSFSNKKRESVWCNTYNYSQNIIFEMLLRKYLLSKFSNINADIGKSVVQLLPKQTLVNIFYHFPKYEEQIEKKKRTNFTVLPFNSKVEKQNDVESYSCQNEIISSFLFPSFFFYKNFKNQNTYLSFNRSILFQSFLGNVFPISKPLDENSFLFHKLFSINSFGNNALASTNDKNYLLLQKNVQYNLFLWSRTLVELNLSHVGNPFFCSEWVASYICVSLRKRESFRRICQKIFRKVKQYPFILGLRIVCSGRFGGAEMARTEIKSYGQTSLHVFNHKIDYAQQVALTSYGLFGIKVWLCFKHVA